MVWLPDGENILMICLFVLTESTNVTDTHTDGRTPHDDIGRACIASRGKMYWGERGRRQSCGQRMILADGQNHRPTEEHTQICMSHPKTIPAAGCFTYTERAQHTKVICQLAGHSTLQRSLLSKFLFDHCQYIYIPCKFHTHNNNKYGPPQP